MKISIAALIGNELQHIIIIKAHIESSQDDEPYELSPRKYYGLVQHLQCYRAPSGPVGHKRLL